MLNISTGIEGVQKRDGLDPSLSRALEKFSISGFHPKGLAISPPALEAGLPRALGQEAGCLVLVAA